MADYRPIDEGIPDQRERIRGGRVMVLQTFDIEDREKRFEAQLPQRDDFTTRTSGTISHQEVLDNPHISLYCLDPNHQNAVFVETPPDLNLAHVPFSYMAQFAHATRVIVAPYHFIRARFCHLMAGVRTLQFTLSVVS